MGTFHIDYKKFYLRVKQTFPFVASDLDSEPPAKSVKQLPDIINAFCQVTGWSFEQVASNQGKSLFLFIAVTARLFNPNIHRFNERYSYGLSRGIAKMLQVDKARILYHDKVSRTHLEIYPEFKREVDDIQNKIAQWLLQK